MIRMRLLTCYMINPGEYFVNSSFLYFIFEMKCVIYM